MVALIVIGILATVVLQKLYPIQADAERVGLENMLGNLKSALGIKVANHIAKDDLRGIQALVGSNPFDLFTDPPANYRGALAGNEIARVGAGEWYFDRSAGALVYRVRNADVFQGGSGLPAEARFALTAVYEDRNRNGRFDRGDSFYGVRLETLAPYRWTQ
jgi:general secretion pathway protein G